LAGEGPLNLGRGRHAGRRRGEGREEGVAVGTFFVPTVGLESGPDDPVMFTQHVRIGIVA
jgi:hypothetical protein